MVCTITPTGKATCRYQRIISMLRALRMEGTQAVCPNEATAKRYPLMLGLFNIAKILSYIPVCMCPAPLKPQLGQTSDSVHWNESISCPQTCAHTSLLVPYFGHPSCRHPYLAVRSSVTPSQSMRTEPRRNRLSL